MGIQRIIQLESDSAIEKTIDIPFTFINVPENKKTGDYITISPMTVRTWYRLKPLLIKIEQADVDKLMAHQEKGFTNDLKEVISKYDNLLFEIVCIGIHNKVGEMPQWFKNVLLDSCTWEDIFILLNAILFRLNSASFSNSIIALKAVSPLDEEEIIALQENRKKWNLRAVSLS